MVYAFAGNADRIRRNIDLNILPVSLCEPIDINNDAHSISYLVRNVFHQLFGITDPDDLSAIITANIKLATLSIRKAAYPLQVFIPPGFFPFNILLFRHSTPPSTLLFFLDFRDPDGSHSSNFFTSS